MEGIEGVDFGLRRKEPGMGLYITEMLRGLVIVSSRKGQLVHEIKRRRVGLGVETEGAKKRRREVYFVKRPWRKKRTETKRSPKDAAGCPFLIKGFLDFQKTPLLSKGRVFRLLKEKCWPPFQMS